MEAETITRVGTALTATYDLGGLVVLEQNYDYHDCERGP